MGSYLIAGVLASVAGLITFLTIHHFWIKPIWFITPAGFLVSTLGGIAVGWAYYEIRAGLPSRPWAALTIAGIIGLSLAPSILLAQLRPPLIEVATFSIPPGDGSRVFVRFLLELVLTVSLVGAAAGWILGHTPRAAISMAMAGIVFAVGPGHNIPFLGNTQSAVKGFVLLAAIIIVSSMVLVEASVWMSRR